MRRKTTDTWTIHVPGLLLLIYLVVAQGITALDYELGVRMGTQEPAEHISEVGVAFWYGFALADLVIYIPLLLLALVGLRRATRWARIVAGAAFGITAYWPIVCLVALVDARGASGWNIRDETAYWVILPVIAAWGIWALWRVSFPARGDVEQRE